MSLVRSRSLGGSRRVMTAMMGKTSSTTTTTTTTASTLSQSQSAPAAGVVGAAATAAAVAGRTMSTSSPYSYVFDPPTIPSLPVIVVQSGEGRSSTQRQQPPPQHFPIHRIYCVGRNYEEHIREMGDVKVDDDSKRTPPVFFTKPVVDGAVVGPPSSSSAAADSAASAATTTPPPVTVEYPPGTTDLHHEVELVVAIGKDVHPRQDTDHDDDHRGCRGRYYVVPHDVPSYVFGFGVGIDLTRRDLQSQSKKSGQPWDTGKYFDQSVPLGPITSVMGDGIDIDGNNNSNNDDNNSNTTVEHVLDMIRSPTAMIRLTVNGQVRQHAPLSTMIWNVQEVVSELSKFYRLRRGDLILTGTPSGVGPLTVGDHVVGSVTFDSTGDDGTDFYIEPVEFVMVECNTE